MAKSNTTDTTTGEPKKRRAPQGPRQEKPIMAFIRVTDKSDGSVLDNVNVEVLLATRDAYEVMRRMKDNKGAEVVEIKVTAAARKAPAAAAPAAA